ncbi:hypothetical protein [Streptomyces sp. MP131-18]|uniref:hypothetical protein n=1 Tax=Streptomyces sp. MP131-18 TaxID=1857892 RepID=UPI00097BABB2|nr:hypothetical protein [Streptomyces sp. MP131-18]
MHLSEAAHLYAECGELLARQAPRQLRERTSGGGASTGIRLNEAAARVRGELLALAGSWSALVAQERSVGAPPRDMAARAAFLRAHVGWLAGHAAAAEVCGEFALGVLAARRVARPGEGPGRLHLGACPEAGCGGELVATAHPAAEAVPDLVTCTADAGHRWPSEQWTRLARRLPAAAGAGGARREGPERWLSVEHVTRLFRIPSGSVYRLASEHGWSRRRRAGRVYYREAEVHDSFARRAGEAGGGLPAPGDAAGRGLS